MPFRPSHIRWSSSVSSQPAIVHIPKGTIYKLGSNHLAPPVLRSVSWTVHAHERWAIIGSSKTTLFETLLGYHRIDSPSPLLPFLSSRDPRYSVSYVSFAPRPLGGPYDYTARYGAIWDEDKKTLRESLLEHSGANSEGTLNILAEKLDLAPLLDLPLITLSNGQTRRTRILRALLSNPELLLLDEPLSGLDASSRHKMLDMIYALHTAKSPLVILGLRAADPLPEWVSHVALASDDKVTTGRKEDVYSPIKSQLHPISVSKPALPRPRGKILAEMKGVNVSYNGRHVLKDINWTIRAGDRWHLQGPNGSGKTTLLALLFGTHPLSYAQPHLRLFGLPRPQIPTPVLHSQIGAVSPELVSAWRAMGRSKDMKARECIGTGFDGTWVMGRKLSAEEDKSVLEIIHTIGPPSDPDFAHRPFATLPSSQQSLVLLMRALVGRKELVVLDEPVGMAQDSVRAYLRGEGGGIGQDKAVVVVSHWDDEMPWKVHEGLRVFRLEGGRGWEA